MFNLLISIVINFFCKPTVYYPVIVILVFTSLRFLNLYFEDILGFRVLNPAIMGIIVGYFFGRQIERERELQKIAISDPLSGLYNRVGFANKLSQFFSKITDKRTISIITIDVDNFKSINDNYGHDVGDVALSAIGKIIKENTRPIDVAARYGGDEFIVILSEANYDTAKRVAKSIIYKINNAPVKTGVSDDIKLSVSIGIASTEDSRISSDKLLKLSDQKLYESKRLGKNRICGIKV